MDAPRAYEGTLAVKNAKLFGIEYLADGVKLVRDGEGNELLLAPRGASVPAAYRGKRVVRTPIERAFFMSTTYIGLLLTLENDWVLDSVAAVITEEGDWTIPAIVERFKRGRIRHIPWNMRTGVDIEALAALRPDMVFSSAGYESGAKLFPKLDELGIDCMEVSEYLEESNIAGMEWLKFFAAFYNLDEQADAVYEKKCARLLELAGLAAEIPEDERPLVALGHVFRGNVYVQGGGSTAVQELERAGCRYFLKDLKGNVNVQINMEEFFNKAKDADVLIYTAMNSFLPDKRALAEDIPLIAEFKAFKNDAIYVPSKGYYMNNGALDVKFEDVFSMFHPGLLPDRELTFYTALPDDASGGARAGGG
ncbi:MAG: ABC transporter substrate-binding protein [Spirochaetaceae bacterium]|nr:ABC transporter substrate-binding protein [Spirochaetaceae bacterium]